MGYRLGASMGLGLFPLLLEALSGCLGTGAMDFLSRFVICWRDGVGRGVCACCLLVASSFSSSSSILERS
jgi:hypothetical protein